MSRFLLAASITVATVMAQESKQPEEQKDSAETPDVDAEFVTSGVFRTGQLAAPLWKKLNFEGHYFGTSEADVAVTGLSWAFNIKGFTLAPGFAASFGASVTPAPVFLLRWSWEGSRWITQGLVAQSLARTVPPSNAESREEFQPIYASILDGNHLTYRLGRFEPGIIWEHVKFRDERSWKVGPRLAIRAGKHVRLLLMVMSPDTEVRGGISWSP